jgi:hypothetical protein
LRKFIGAVVVAALAAGLLALPATASFDPHFSVIAKQTSGHQVGHNKFRFQDKLLDPRDRSDKVGRDWGVCKFRHHAIKCRVLVHLNGEIGGFGNISAAGDIARHDRRVNVVGGTHDFNGVAGKVIVRSLHQKNTNRLIFTLTR